LTAVPWVGKSVGGRGAVSLIRLVYTDRLDRLLFIGIRDRTDRLV